MSFSSIADAANASERLYDCFCAELLDEVKDNNPDLDVAIKVDNASFTWDAPPPDTAPAGKTSKKSKKAERLMKEALPVEPAQNGTTVEKSLSWQR